MGVPKKGGLGHFADLGGGLRKKEGGGVFEGGLIPQCTLCTSLYDTYCLGHWNEGNERKIRNIKLNSIIFLQSLLTFH